MANAMMVLTIYKRDGLWCFTDEEHNLKHEPFVLGTTELIDKTVTDFNLGTLEESYRLIFSEMKFPEYQGRLFYQYSEHNGVWYAMSTTLNDEMNSNSPRGWLCPATMNYFEIFPKNIYFRLERITVPNS